MKAVWQDSAVVQKYHGEPIFQIQLFEAKQVAAANGIIPLASQKKTLKLCLFGIWHKA